jgi:hypothetical protein
LSGLVAKLKKLEPEFREVAEETRSLQRDVVQPGGLRRKRTKKQKP